MTQPKPIRAYYILHITNLSKVIEANGLLSDAKVRRLNPGHVNIGMNRVKEQRLIKPVPCHRGTTVGEYVPFYLCPRSVMLYVIHRANSSELVYRDGQEPIVHLELDVAEVVNWANEMKRPWAASYGNAASAIARFSTGRGTMAAMNWPAIGASQWQDPDIREAKQAEFLVYEDVPWKLIRRIGVLNQGMRQRVADALESAGHRPPIVIQPAWYY